MNEFIYEPSVVKNTKFPATFRFRKFYGLGHTEHGASVHIPNWHEDIEILYFVYGKASVHCGSAEYTVRPGDMIVVNPNIIHTVATDDYTEYYYLIPDTAFLTANEINMTGLFLEEFLHDETANRYFEQIISSNKTGDRFSIAATRAAILTLIAYLASSRSYAYTPHQHNKTIERIRLAIEYIDTNVSSRITVDEIAAKAGLSKYHFLREFKHFTGNTVVSYINLRRCNLAKLLLEKPENNVSDVATKCGFENLSYFSKTFKKYIGISPVKFRANKNLK